MHHTLGTIFAQSSYTIDIIMARSERAQAALLALAAWSAAALAQEFATDRQLRETLRPGLKPTTAFSAEYVVFRERGLSLGSCKASCMENWDCEALFWWQVPAHQYPGVQEGHCRGLTSLGRIDGANTKLYGRTFEMVYRFRAQDRLAGPDDQATPAFAEPAAVPGFTVFFKSQPGLPPKQSRRFFTAFSAGKSAFTLSNVPVSVCADTCVARADCVGIILFGKSNLSKCRGLTDTGKKQGSKTSAVTISYLRNTATSATRCESQSVAGSKSCQHVGKYCVCKPVTTVSVAASTTAAAPARTTFQAMVLTTTSNATTNAPATNTAPTTVSDLGQTAAASAATALPEVTTRAVAAKTTAATTATFSLTATTKLMPFKQCEGCQYETSGPCMLSFLGGTPPPKKKEVVLQLTVV